MSTVEYSKIVSKFDQKSMENRPKMDPKIELGGVLGGIWGGLGQSKVGLGSPGPILIEKVGSLALRWPSLAPHLGPPNRPKSIKNLCQDA